MILLDGVTVTALEGAAANAFRRRKIGFVFQAFHLIPNLSALENVMLPLQLAGAPRSKQRERARELLVQVGIDEQRQAHRPGKLSGGTAVEQRSAGPQSSICCNELRPFLNHHINHHMW